GSGLGGLVSWIFCLAASALEYLPSFPTRRSSDLYTIKMSNGTLSVGHISVTITGTNDAPVVAATDVSGAVTELGMPVGNLTDSDTGSAHDCTLVTASSRSASTPSEDELGTLTASV